MKELFVISAKFHGDGQCLFSWQPGGNFLATAGANGLVHVFDRNGEQVDEIALESGKCKVLQWDYEGEMFAVLQEGNPRITLWDSTSRTTSRIDTNMKDPTFLEWSKLGPQLAIGTAKGNLVLYNKESRKSTPILGKHSKKVTCGAWSATSNVLAMGSVDHVLTISDEAGNTTDQTELKYEPLGIQFASQKMDGRARSGTTRPHTTVSINMGGYTILLYNLEDPENPVELAFQPRYGQIVKYEWFGDGYMLIGFSEGFIVVISTHMKEIVEELFSGEFHKDGLSDIAFSEAMQRAATVGTNTIKLIDVKGWKEIKEETTTIDPVFGKISGVSWTDDGQILTVATRNGTIFNYLARMPTVFDCSGTRVAYMSSLRELTVKDTFGAAPLVTLPVSVEPSFVALGANHVAVGMNNRVWYHRANPADRKLVNEREYLSTVDDVRLSSRFAGVLCEGKVNVHLVEPGTGEDPGTMILPNRDDSPPATCIAMTEDFVIYGTQAGAIEFFYMGDWTLLAGAELRHDEGIRGVFPNAAGTRLIFVDMAYRGFLYNPTNQLVLPVPKLHETTQRIMWDAADWGVFVTTDNRYFHTYLHTPLTVNGPQITQLGSIDIKDNGDMVMEAVPTEVPHNYAPVLVHDGMVTCQIPSGSMSTVVLHTHDSVSNRGGDAPSRAAFSQNLALLRLEQAWQVARAMEARAFWLALSGKAMEVLNIGMAVKVYRELGDAGMVMALEQIQETEDKNLLAGQIAMLFADYQQAQDLLLASSRPIAALEMRRDLLHWDQALKLAPTLAPEQLPELSLEYGKQQEFRGEHAAALSMYQGAARSLPPIEATPDDAKLASLHRQCLAGLTRTTLRTGDLRKGLTMANSSGDKQLLKDCGAILEGLKQYNDAADMYKKAEQYDKAASVLIHTKNFAAVAPLLQYVTLPKLHAQYAKAKEASKEYLEAARAYERARDMDSVVRLLLEHLNQPERASEVVRSTNSSEGARMVSKYCQSVGDFRGAIEFLLIAKRNDDAFELAKEHKEMALYAQALEGTATEEDYMRIAKYYESKTEYGEAGKFYARCGQYHKALSFFLQCGEAMLDEAIKVVGKARNDILTHTLIDFLMGETDGVPKDPHFIFRLYMALGNFLQAGRTAIIIAKQEQEMGNYKVAHNILFQTYTDLEEHKIRVPQDLQRQLLLLHSYILVKKLVKQNDHPGAARMLIRVAKNISKFPSHMVPILTSTVIECQRAGLKRSAFEYASMMMRPEYRQHIEPKFKRKIEALVRRPNKEEAEEPVTACPFCRTALPGTELDCPSCKNNLPYCVVTGQHMVFDDWSRCPNCKFPALHSALVSFCASDTVCPMCEKEIDTAAIEKVHDPTSLLKPQEETESKTDEESKGEEAE